jgi:hypothetical protein
VALQAPELPPAAGISLLPGRQPRVSSSKPKKKTSRDPGGSVASLTFSEYSTTFHFHIHKMAFTEHPRRVRGWALQHVRRSLRKISGMRLVDEEDNHTAPHSPRPNLLDGVIPEASGSQEVPRISREQMEATANPQAASSFFTKLPPEIRRLIYESIWRDYLGPAMRVHIHSASDTKHLQHTRCTADLDVALEEDPWGALTVTGEGDNAGIGADPPPWFWWAWCLRTRWGRHWQCQRAVMKRWTEESIANRLDWAPMMLLFLTSKRMYAEAVQSFLGSVTFCFTGSEDAHHFLIQSPHPFRDSIRSLDFNFCHHKDHLFLVSIEAKHPRISRCSGVPVGIEAWNSVMSAVRESTPALRSLRLLINNRLPAPEPEFWSVFTTWQPQHLLIELPPIRKKYEIHHGKAISASGGLPSALRLLNESRSSEDSL